MRIDELDELQGVTPQLVTDWLLANGWTQTKPRWWERGEDGFLFDSETFDSLWFWTYALAAIYTGGNVQALLREINPRMRKGMPSEAAWLAHGEANGLWLCLWGDIPTNEQHWELFFRGRPFVTKLRKYDAMWEWGIRGLSWSDCPEMPHGIDFLFWPCDANGNKVRWPTDAEGNML